MYTTIQARGSRGALKGLCKHVETLLNEARELNDRILENEEQLEVDHQQALHLRYIQQVGTVADDLEQYLQARVNDEPSVIASLHMPLQSSNQREDDHSSHRSSVARSHHNQQPMSLREAENGRRSSFDRREAELREVEIRLQSLNVNAETGIPFGDPNNGNVQRWCADRQRWPTNELVEDHDQAPDVWIDLYSAGQLPPHNWMGRGAHASVKAELEPYSGKALEWFCWIDLFRALVHDTAKSPGEKLALLKRSLRGDCVDIVHGLGGGEAAYIEALVRLKQNCGRRDVMRAAHFQAIERLELRNDPSSFKRFSEKIRTHLFDLNRIGETSSADLIERICLKLQLQDRLAWNADRRETIDERSLNNFGNWLCLRPSAYQNAYSLAADQLQPAAGSINHRQRPARTHQSSSKFQVDEKMTRLGSIQPYCFKCEGHHRVQDCNEFKALLVGDRVSFCARHRLCYSCFGTRHSARDCRVKKTCRYPNCKMWHHALLHDPSREVTDGSRNNTLRSKQPQRRQVVMGMVRLNVITEDGSVFPANVFVDEGSDTTLIREDFAHRLKLRGDRQILAVDGAGHVVNHYRSRRVDIKLRADSVESFDLQASTLPTVASPTPVIDWSRLKLEWPHLSDLPIGISGGRIDILLGMDYGHLVATLESRVGREDEPVASRTRLGWIVRGVIGAESSVYTIRLHHVSSSTSLTEIANELRRFCDTENFGTEYQTAALSIDDQRAVKILEDETRKLETGYEVPITWRVGEPNFESFYLDYRAALQKTFTKGYASKVDNPSADTVKYFLSHHGVYKGTKLRVVFDAAAMHRGKCLNDAILSGPALQPSLPAVLIQFREGEVAWASDVEAMFSRFRLRSCDTPYFFFLWQETPSEKPVVYRMNRLPFGASCSPFVAIQTTRRAAIDAGADELVVQAILRKMYVDDYLGSAPTVALGLKEAEAVTKVLASADLHLQGWISNSKRFIREITKNATILAATTRPHALTNSGPDTVLGITWNIASDSLGFSARTCDDLKYTRAGLTSKVASVFDPLGTASPFIIKAKIKLREIGIKGLDWSDEVSEDEAAWWRSWFRLLSRLPEATFNRCLFPDETKITSSQLHIFCDASEEAYAAVVYIRNVWEDGRIRCSQIKACTKLAPMKTLSVPKLELNAALLGARLAKFVQSSLTRSVTARRFWTDSSTVRNWVRASASSYQVFVANRVGEIQTITETEEWRFVPGRLNPADTATRSAIDDEVLPKVWMEGPDFLFKMEDEWPKDLPWMVVNEEIKSSKINHSKSSVTYNWSTLSIDQTNLSSVLRLEGEFLNIIKICQQEAFGDDLHRLENGKTLKSTSHLLALSPWLGKDGLLRLGGRIGRAKLPYDVLHPPLLPSKHPLTENIISALHREMHHAGTDYLFSKLLQHFWVVRGREAVKRIRHNCTECIRERAAPAAQMMGEIPSERLESLASPFTHTAVDYFGPLETSPGRNRVNKRYGALFTCLVTRAVHLELAFSLSSDDFLLALRRFIGIYTKPRTVHSDNGTNFVGAERELNSLVNELHSSEDLTRFKTEKAIDWRFQPPRAPHFGGAHESLVRSTKKALYRALETEKKGLRFPSDETLRTILAEIAGLLNSPPLTYTSTDPADLRPLTPNDFMNRPPTSDLPAGSFDDVLPREQFRYVQRMMNLFWDLWTKYYLPSLAPRKKWKTKHRNMSVNDVVMLIDPNVPRGQWKIGSVSKTFPGADGLIRVVEVQTEGAVFVRPVHRLCLLEASSRTEEGGLQDEPNRVPGDRPK
ncbi:uncharacterized protein LOC130700052 [Daphnia carinata]|uniref:uncharacterized protein LOC130700052 n=1 Tax=Daphnia carinata TaxID=120202 RepID=UPI00257E38C2|nr:uncharacterized protein LOC130700052 [Daphnia carinata]